MFSLIDVVEDELIRLIAQILLNAPPGMSKKKIKKSVVEYSLSRITGGWIGKKADNICVRLISE